MWNLSQATWKHQNLAPKLALALKATVDQTIQDHFAQGFSDLNRRQLSHLFHEGVWHILSKPFASKIQWIQNLLAAHEPFWRLQGRTGTKALMITERSLIRQ
jgi:hypothetical protein